MATLFEYEQNPSVAIERTALYGCLETFTPANAQEALLEGVERPLYPLNRLPARVAGHEWLLTRAEVKRALRGAPPVWMREGKRVFGPVAAAEARREVCQLISLYRSIRDNGFRPELATDPIRGFLLVRGRHYRFVLTGGQHRVAALRVLGEDAVTVRLEGMGAVYEDKIMRWSDRYGGPYPLDVALLLFDRLFSEDGRRKAQALGIVQ